MKRRHHNHFGFARCGAREGGRPLALQRAPKRFGLSPAGVDCGTCCALVAAGGWSRWSVIRDFAEVAAAQGLPVTEYADVLRASDAAELERLRRGAA